MASDLPQEIIYDQFSEIIDNGVIVDYYCNCIYNRGAVSFIYKHEKKIDSIFATQLIKKVLDKQMNCRGVNAKIYHGLTLLKITTYLLDRFRNYTKFIQTMLNKILEINKEIKTLINDNTNDSRKQKFLINSERVLLNICEKSIEYRHLWPIQDIQDTYNTIFTLVS